MIKNDSQAPSCTCPSGDGSLRHPCPAHPAQVEQAGDERVIGWRERILAAHPSSDPGFWPDALLVEHMAAEIADLRAALAQPSPAGEYGDAYQGAREDIAIWKRRALEAEQALRQAHNGQTFMGEPLVQPYEAPREKVNALFKVLGFSGTASVGDILDAALERLQAQPSPAQAEKAEVERTEGSADLLAIVREAVAGAYNEWKMISEAVTEIMEAHERIVGELRAENAKLSDDLNRLSIIRARLNLRLDFALDKISKLESRWPHGESPEERFEHYISNTIDRAPGPLRRLGNWLSHVLDEDQWTTAERMLTGACVAAEERAAAQTQHSVPEGWKLVPVEPTEDVLEAIHNGGYVGDDQELRWFYQSILAAAPAPGGE
ncbi:hypothetical protein L4Z13_000542 [Pseudomonas aeruginosa]|nr:hypothetical protein [Pseudomonas aeruginosa]